MAASEAVTDEQKVRHEAISNFITQESAYEHTMFRYMIGDYVKMMKYSVYLWEVTKPYESANGFLVTPKKGPTMYLFKLMGEKFNRILAKAEKAIAKNTPMKVIVYEMHPTKELGIVRMKKDHKRAYGIQKKSKSTA